MNTWDQIPDENVINRATGALKQNGMEALVVENGEAAKQKVLQLIPKGAEVMTMSSVTLEDSGIDKEINDSGRFNAIRKKLYALDRTTQRSEMLKLGAAPEYAVGSVHAVTEDGKVLIASNTGSQLPAYAYGSAYVIWVVGAQKIVKNLDEGMKRLYDYVLPLEHVHMQKKYGAPGSNVSKLLIVNKEIVPGRITIIFVKEKLGY